MCRRWRWREWRPGRTASSSKCIIAPAKRSATARIYSRYANPTLSIFEERLRLIEGAEACRGTASGMAAVSAALLCKVRAGERVVASRALFGSCSWVLTDLMPRYGVTVELVDGTDLEAWAKRLVEADLDGVPGNPLQPDAGADRHRGGGRTDPQGRRPADGRQCIRHTLAAAADGTRRRYRGLFRHQAYRRAGPHLGRCGALFEPVPERPSAAPICATPVRPCRPSMPGCCSRGWRRWRCGSRAISRMPQRSPPF